MANTSYKPGTYKFIQNTNQSQTLVDVSSAPKFTPISNNLSAGTVSINETLYNKSLTTRERVNAENIVYDNTIYQTQNVLAQPTSGSNYLYGNSVAVSGDFAIVGAPGVGAISAYLFERRVVFGPNLLHLHFPQLISAKVLQSMAILSQLVEIVA